MTPPQLALWANGNHSTQPLPLQVASEYGFSLQHHTQDDDTIVYAVQDWIAGVAKTDQPRVMWKQIQKRTVSGAKTVDVASQCVQMPYRATNGKTYQMDFASDVTLYQITQRMSASTGIRDDVLTYLAKAGAFVDELRQDPETAEIKIASHRQSQAVKAGKDAEWISARETGVTTRKQFVTMLMALNPDVNIGRATNDVYQGVFGKTAAGLRKVLNIGEKQNPRDHMSRLALGYTMIAEEACRIQLAGYQDNDALPLKVIHSVLETISQATGIQAGQMASALKIDLVTGKALLPSHTARP